MAYHNGSKFSTPDQDNDHNGGSCATTNGPWWHNNCSHSGLNRKFSQNLYWGRLSGHAAETSVMMIRKL